MEWNNKNSLLLFPILGYIMSQSYTAAETAN